MCLRGMAWDALTHCSSDDSDCRRPPTSVKNGWEAAEEMNRRAKSVQMLNYLTSKYRACQISAKCENVLKKLSGE